VLSKIYTYICAMWKKSGKVRAYPLRNDGISILSVLKSEYFADALRNTLAILIPIILLWGLSYRAAAIGVGAGTIVINLSDLPGNRNDKFKNAWIALLVLGIAALFTALSLPHPVALVCCLVALTFCFTMLGALGNRLELIGMMGIIMAVFTLGIRPQNPWNFAFYVCAGGIWYHLISLLQISIFPFRSLHQAIEGYFKDLSALLRLRASGYDPAQPLTGFNEKNIRLHLKLTAKQELIRQLLLGDKMAMNAKSTKGKLMLQKALNLMDLYEEISAVHYDYPFLRKSLAETGALPLISTAIYTIANHLQLGSRAKSAMLLQKLQPDIEELSQLATNTHAEIRPIIEKVVTNLSTVTELVKAVLDEQPADRGQESKQRYQDFIAEAQRQQLSFLAHLSLRSPIFRFALRLAVLCLAAMLVVTFFSEQKYANWLLITLVVVSRPSYVVTKTRNWERLYGTITGIVIAYVLILFHFSTQIQLVVISVFLFGFFALGRLRYWMAVICITAAVILFFDLYHGGTLYIVSERISFTLIGCLLCLLAVYLFPIWESQRLGTHLAAVIEANRAYLHHVLLESGQQPDQASQHQTRLARKKAYQQLALLSGAIAATKKEPLGKKIDLSGVRQVELLCYQLNALIASLAGSVRREVAVVAIAEARLAAEALQFNVGNADKLTLNPIPSISNVTARNGEKPMDLLSVAAKLKTYFIGNEAGLN
jgi:uncharacterized membrane protein YccC